MCPRIRRECHLQSSYQLSHQDVTWRCKLLRYTRNVSCGLNKNFQTSNVINSDDTNSGDVSFDEFTKAIEKIGVLTFSEQVAYHFIVLRTN